VPVVPDWPHWLAQMVLVTLAALVVILLPTARGPWVTPHHAGGGSSERLAEGLVTTTWDQ
jgi:hypothetical protein